MKIAVYTICKNEEKFVDRWINSMAEADGIFVLDTGSTDNTAEKLKSRGAFVTVQKISPWRFDVARNLSLALVPEDYDICICTDLDEVFEHGWRSKLEDAWHEKVAQARYRYTWSYNPDGSEGVVFFGEKIHSRKGYKWVHPVHEVLKWIGDGNEGQKITVEDIHLCHYPDNNKPRSQYLPLLELSLKEEPNDDRCAHYLGREYMFYRRWDDCISTLKRHLSMPNATWKDERAASMRYIAKSYLNKGQRNEAINWYLKAIAEAPHLREAYIELANMLYEDKNWEGVIYFTGCALQIKERPLSYICEAAPWGSLPHDLRAIAYYNLGKFDLSLKEAKHALSFEPDNERLKGNVRIIGKKI